VRVEVRNLKKVFGGRTVLYVPDLSMGEGIYVVRGPNGSGKTTFLKVIAGIVRPTEGEVWVLGGDPFKDGKIRRRIAFVGHRTGLIEDLNGYENATLFLCGLFRCPKMREFLRLAEDLGVGGLLKRPVRTLSRGERTKLSISIAVAHGGEVLLLDEPFAPLDTESREVLAETLTSLKGTVVITAHGDIPPMGGSTITFPMGTSHP